MSARSIRVERAGLQTLLVDRGRFGYRDRGVAWCGAMDLLAFALAQQLVGNDGSSAAVEVVLGDVEFLFDAPARCALAGADCAATLDGATLPGWAAFTASAGARLRLHRPRSGMRTIVAFDGGPDVPPVMGSRTTDCMARIGGLDGRALRAGDRFALGAPVEPLHRAGAIAIDPPQADFAREAFASPAMPVRVLVSDGFEALWQREWRVGHESNRMGCHLRGEPVAYDAGGAVTRAVFPGVVQLPPAGEPIVLLSDAQTTGGYPIAGVVIEADLWMLAQLPLGGALRFVPSTREAAQEASARIAEYVERMRARIASCGSI